MIYPEYKWVETAFNGAYNRNQVVRINELKLPKNSNDCYRTVYRYPEEFKQYFDIKGTVKGYAGSVYADFFPIDIDNNDLQQAHKTAIQALNELLYSYEIDLDNLRIFFSGNKGFHILIPAILFGYKPSIGMPQVFKVLSTKLFKNIELDGSVYDRMRIFRISNTINSKSGLYKVPLTPAEVLHKTTEEIKELAKAPRKVEIEKPETENEYLKELYRECRESLTKNKNTTQERTEITPPRNAKLCYYEILKGVSEGNRDNAGLRLAVHLLKEYPQDMVQPMMLAWNQRNNPPMEDRNVDKLVKQAMGEYDYGCRDNVLAEYCNPKCIYKAKKEGRVTAEKVYSLDDAANRYLEYINALQERKILLGFEKLDKHLRGIAPGEVCEVIARTGVGKTAFLLNVIKQVIHEQNVPVLFFSLEQPLAQIYERAVQISSEIEGSRIEKEYNSVAKALHMEAQQYYDKLFVVEEDYLTYEELKDFTLLAKDKIGRMPPLVCIDYLGRMKGGGINSYEVTSELAKLTKLFAKELDVAVLYLNQTSRAGKTGAEEITFDSARDSGVTEEAADFILGMWRPELNKEDAQKRDYEELVISVLKNRKGRIGQHTYKFVKPYLRVESYIGGEERKQDSNTLNHAKELFGGNDF